jgi:cellulose synthase/poly-beta-1,6-N-acetylglucosamine synthase-like glycosyltransferase
MKVFFTIWYIFQIWLAIYLVIPFIFLLIYGLKKLTRTRFHIAKLPTIVQKDFDFAAVITAHRDVLLVPALVDSLLKQQYREFMIYVVADGCDVGSLRYQDPRVVVLQPEEMLNSKIRSINFALENFRRAHDALVILDSDNLVHPGFLSAVNVYFQKGFRAVQTNLQPKNTDSVFARIDSMGDTFYNFIEREMRMELGFSSAIWGSGIVVETALYKEISYSNLLGGFDKMIQAYIVQHVPQLAFAREAIVYDEKISSGASLEQQRTRWIHAYFKYLRLGWQTFLLGWKRKSANLVFFGFFNLRPPLFMVYLIGCLICLLHFWVEHRLFIYWLVVLIVFVFSFLAIVLIKSTNKKTIWSVFFMPLFILYQLAALFRIRRAGKRYLKTEHSKLVYIEDLLRNEPA